MYAPIHLPAPSQPWEPESNSATECELLGCQNTLSATYHFKLNTQPVEPQSNPNGDKKSWPVSSLVSACRCAQNEFPFANIRLIFSSILTSGSQIGTSVSTSRCQIHGTENKSWWFTHKTEHARYKSLQNFFLVQNRPKNSVFCGQIPWLGFLNPSLIKPEVDNLWQIKFLVEKILPSFPGLIRSDSCGWF